ncbi:MAG: hypothetical protein HYX55_05400 [Chloroflexi bacterium]|nr:hypothetical protein [Chloroflexota bacterium]
MTDLSPVWISTIAFCVLTTVGFIILAEWSAGGAAPWSIAAGVVRGIHDWGDDKPSPVRIVSTPATAPQPPMDTGALPLPPLVTIEGQPAPKVEEYPSADELAQVEIEELTTRRR